MFTIMNSAVSLIMEYMSTPNTLMGLSEIHTATGVSTTNIRTWMRDNARQPSGSSNHQGAAYIVSQSDLDAIAARWPSN